MNDSEQARAARALERSETMQVRLEPRHPGQEHDFNPVTGAAAVALAAKLSRSAWTLSGHPLPNYTRGTMPVHLTRGSPA
jgi:hypothetical protein